MSIKDQRYINPVDTLISNDTMKVPRFHSSNIHSLTGKSQTFVAQCDEDYRLLMKLVADTTEALGRRGKIFGWFRPKGQPSPQPIDPSEVIYKIIPGLPASNRAVFS